MTDVWKLVPYHVQSCADHGGTKKTYKFILLAHLPTMERAKELVIEQTYHTPECFEYLNNIPFELRSHFMEQFCFFDDQYLHLRRFFIDRPPLERFRKFMRQYGVIVLE